MVCDSVGTVYMACLSRPHLSERWGWLEAGRWPHAVSQKKRCVPRGGGVKERLSEEAREVCYGVQVESGRRRASVKKLWLSQLMCEIVCDRDPWKVLSRKKVSSDLFPRKSHLWQNIYSDLSF